MVIGMVVRFLSAIFWQGMRKQDMAALGNMVVLPEAVMMLSGRCSDGGEAGR